MSNSANGLMLDGVHVFKGMVEDTRCVDGLKPKHLVVAKGMLEMLRANELELRLTNVLHRDSW